MGQRTQATGPKQISDLAKKSEVPRKWGRNLPINPNMGKFSASLRLPGDSQALDAVVRVQEGRITVASGEHEIGDWEIGRVELTRIPEGFRLESDGEVLLLDIPDRASFEEEANSMNGKKRKSRRSRRPKTQAEAKAKVEKPRRQKTDHATAVRPQPERSDSGRDTAVDRFLTRAQTRFGEQLPSWVFTRGGLVVVLALIALTVVFAELISTLLMIAGVIGLLVGGITMLDSVIARKLLRHRITPIKVVIAAGSIFVAGLLLGVLA